MKLLITGASGLYGSKLAELATTKGHQVYSMHSQHQATHGIPIQVEISDKIKVETEIKKINPEVIIHAATMTDVDKCELNRELAWKINVDGTETVTQAAKLNKAFFIYISTDYVFDGSKGNYTETDLPSPLSYYAYTKLKAEEHVKATVDDYCIARPSVIYGAQPAAGKVNFALWILNNLRNKEQANVFIDQWNSPTLNTSLAEMTLEIAERKSTGIYHLSGATRISRYDFAKALAKTFELDQSLLNPSSLKDFAFPAKRPKDSSLNTTKASQSLRNKPLTVDQALERLKKEITN
jgi:dTDP-4-dehydrorhamnose reductase